VCKSCFSACTSLTSATFESNSKLQRIEDLMHQLRLCVNVLFSIAPHFQLGTEPITLGKAFCSTCPAICDIAQRQFERKHEMNDICTCNWHACDKWLQENNESTIPKFGTACLNDTRLGGDRGVRDRWRKSAFWMIGEMTAWNTRKEGRKELLLLVGFAQSLLRNLGKVSNEGQLS
jgi:hypothetical protein